MAKFKSKPVVIEAIRFMGEQSIKGMREEWGQAFMDRLVGCAQETGGSCDVFELYIKTLEGTMTAKAGDWIIKGLIGEFYPCKHEVFTAKYELA